MAERETAAPGWRGRFGRLGLAGVGPVGMVSVGSDGEGVEVVGEDRPADPGCGAVVAFEAAARQPVAAFEVRDPAFAADAVAGQSSSRAFRVGLLAAGDEHGGAVV